MARANAEMETFKLYANFGEDQLGSVDMMHHGSSNGLFNFGWERNYVVIDVPMDGAVTIGVEGSTNTAHSWMSFADFRLVKIGVMDYDRDTTITVAPTDNVWMAYVGQEKEVSLTIAHTGTTGTIAPFSWPWAMRTPTMPSSKEASTPPASAPHRCTQASRLWQAPPGLLPPQVASTSIM